MAIIYGRADSEKQLLDLYPKRVKTIEDIDRVHQELRKDIKNELEAGFSSSIKNQAKSLKSTNLRKTKTIHIMQIHQANWIH